MNTVKLENALNGDEITKRYFRGVFASDQIPAPCTPGFYIVNLDTSTEPGSHWIGLKIASRGKNEFFDSYGFAPQNTKFKKILGKTYLYNRKKLQHPDSTTCGQWCLFYIFFAARGHTLKKIFKTFSSGDKKINDSLVNFFVRRTFQISTQIINRQFILEQVVQSLLRNLQCNDYYCRRCYRV